MLTLKPPVYMASGSFPRDPILCRALGGETRGGPLAAVALVAALVLVPEAVVRGVCWRDQGCGSKHDAEDGESGKYLLHAVLPWDFGRECRSLSATCALALAAEVVSDTWLCCFSIQLT